MRELTLEFSRVTEAAALAVFSEIGKGNKEKADDKAVRAMKSVLNKLKFEGEIVIGEGEIDEAPMLYIGEKVGLGGETKCDIAVDPIDGTRMVALGQDEAVAVIVFAKKGSLLKAPDMYMEKLMVNSLGKESVDLDKPLAENIKNLAKKLDKNIFDLTVMTLQKPRHEKQIKEMQNLGVKVIAIPDGDVEGSILVTMPETDIDMFYGIGGAPEGVISAGIIRSMNGDMQARLLTRSQAKGKSLQNDSFSEEEIVKCNQLNLKIGKKLTINDLSSSDELVVSMTGITDGKLLKGVKMKKGYASTETLLIRGKSQTVRKITSTHVINNKDIELQKILNEKK